MATPDPILIACCGNPIMGDDAFGPLVASELRRRPAAGVEVLELAAKPASLLDHLPQRSAMLIVDAAVAPGRPLGDLIEMDWDSPRRPALVSERSISTHGISIADQIVLARATGLLPAVVRLFAVSIGAHETFAVAATEVSARVPDVAGRIVEFSTGLLCRWRI